MAILYHGTKKEFALRIAERGAILSPLEQDIELYASDERVTKMLQYFYPGMSLRDIVIEMKTKQYSAHELPHRLFCVSLTRDFLLALSYAGKDGFILGIEHPDNNEKTTFVPEKVSLDDLKEIHSLGIQPYIKRAFEKYSPKYKKIKKDQPNNIYSTYIA